MTGGVIGKGAETTSVDAGNVWLVGAGWKAIKMGASKSSGSLMLLQPTQRDASEVCWSHTARSHALAGRRGPWLCWRCWATTSLTSPNHTVSVAYQQQINLLWVAAGAGKWLPRECDAIYWECSWLVSWSPFIVSPPWCLSYFVVHD